MKTYLTLILIFICACGSACAEYWDEPNVKLVECCENRPGCHVLQTVMTGSFAQMDAENSLSVRVLSAALPRLAAVTEDDFRHFSEYFGVDIEVITYYYNIALANCLWADMIITPIADDIDEQNARTVLHLFIDPISENANEQMQAIRENCTPQMAQLLADSAHVPVGFVEYLLDLPHTD